MASPTAFSPSPSLSLLSLFLPIFFCFFVTSDSIPISLSLNPLPPFLSTPSADPLQEFSQLASASLSRAKRLKNHRSATTPIFPHSYGAYSISLGFGTPPQKSSLVMDTGSSLVWIPCTRHYSCKRCSFNSSTAPFIPKSSSSSRIVGCTNPKCSWISGPDSLRSRCDRCDGAGNSSSCSQICPPYFVLYGSGSTGGILLSETLVLPEKRVPDFAVGCSLFSTRMPAGIAGFGRSPSSLPSQLGLRRFSYCLLSHRFDDDGSNSSPLVLDGAGSESGSAGVSYTPFLKNPAAASNSASSVYYYVGLRRISVGGKDVKIERRYLRLGHDGNGGTIVDSGTTFTFMEKRVFEPLAREMVAQVGSLYAAAPEVESRTGLRPCFKVPGATNFTFPKLVFHFKGGKDMELPVANYFSLVGDLHVACMTVVTDDGDLPAAGPAVVLGNFQQQNFYLEFDLEKERFGFRRQLCHQPKGI